MEIPIKMDDLGGTPIFGNTHIPSLKLTASSPLKIGPKRPKREQVLEKPSIFLCHVTCNEDILMILIIGICSMGRKVYLPIHEWVNFLWYMYR